jgi:hypothetical protein
MRYRKPINFFLGKIDRIWLPLSKQPAGYTMAVPSVFCERCTTDSQCDPCYLTQWMLFCKQFDLCTACGVPNHLEHLPDEIHMKFTCTATPCEGCRPRQSRFLQSRGYCLLCFQKMDMDLNMCYTCHCICDPEEDTCKPYECQCGCRSCSSNREAYDAAEGAREAAGWDYDDAVQ